MASVESCKKAEPLLALKRYIVQVSVRMNRLSEASGGFRAPDRCRVPCFNESLVASIKLLLPDSEVLRQTAALYSALSDPTRLRILVALSFGELCVCDVAHVLGMSVAATSHQLRFLKNLAVVRNRTDGKMSYYSLPEDTPLKAEIERSLSRHGLAESVEAKT